MMFGSIIYYKNLLATPNKKHLEPAMKQAVKTPEIEAELISSNVSSDFPRQYGG
jgi:hypothetical protein